MRTSLSCDSCRRSKVKCVHSGSPPCNRCEKSQIQGCTLSRPKTPIAKSNQNRDRLSRGNSEATPSRTPRSSAASRRRNGHEATSQRRSHRTPPLTADSGHGKVVSGAEANCNSYSKEEVGRHINNLPNGVVLKCLNVFTNKFPELSILHLPSFLNELQSSYSVESVALLSATLAVTRSQSCVLNASWAAELLPRENYACYAKDVLGELILQPPKIYVVQALLIIAMHEWGSRDFHKAWIYCGIAIRIMQAIHSARVAAYPLDTTSERHSDAVTVAVETRTYWACFIMDCMVNSGTYNPPMLAMSEMAKLKIPRPLSVVEFAFGPEVPSHTPRDDLSFAKHSTGVLDITQGFEILVAGFDVWTQLMTFVFNDGRRAPGMCAPANCPWVPGSPWYTNRNQLENWRANQHQKLHYPNNSVAVHMTLGYGETFSYLNLLYYVSTLMLHREYFPFLPTLESTPQGPVDQPMLEATAPDGWWNESARVLFGAAENIALVLNEASECGVPLMTPFTGFCAFSAAYLNLYIYYFPRMNLGRSLRAKECMEMCLDYLHEFRKVWRIADGWIKTVQHASLLYGRAVEDRARYQGRTRTDFDALHQSVHEFRVVDRSDQHTQEIDGADQMAPEPQQRQSREGTANEVDTNTLLNQLMAEVSSNLDEQGAWSQWWPAVDDVDLPPTSGQGNSLML